MAGETDVFIIEVEHKIEVLLILIEAYKADIITKPELLSALVDLLFQN